MASVDAAEKEASEVLHSLLSVERIVKPEGRQDGSGVIDIAVQTQAVSDDRQPQDTDPAIQWHTPVTISSHSLFSAIDDANQHFPQTIDEQQVEEMLY